jgi:methyl-accepting chemotaxis protein
MKSIKTRLIITFTAVILVLTTTLGAISINLISNDLIKNTHTDLQRIAQLEAKYIQSQIDKELS